MFWHFQLITSLFSATTKLPEGQDFFFTFTFPHCVTHCSHSRIKTKYAPPALAVPEAPVDPAGRKKLQWYEGTHFDTHREILNEFHEKT